eukprot:scaffold207132_cov13-Tisochrysis_lutea.AAC.1
MQILLRCMLEPPAPEQQPWLLQPEAALRSLSIKAALWQRARKGEEGVGSPEFHGREQAALVVFKPPVRGGC